MECATHRRVAVTEFVFLYRSTAEAQDAAMATPEKTRQAMVRKFDPR